MTTTDGNRLLASLVRDQIAFDLKTTDICFLAGLYLQAERACLTSFEEDLLIDQFEQVCDIVEPGAENPRKRATHAIERLREQRMLARVDSAGIIRAGEYALTRLAAGVIEYFLADEALTRESLSLLTGTLRVQLAEILAAARKAASDGEWRTQVIGPLRVTVGDLVTGIERRQRGMDAQQEEVQAEITGLLSDNWSKAIDSCSRLLDLTATTLRELNEILLRDTHHFIALLQEIQALASGAGNSQAEQAAQRVIEQVDRIAAWGGARQRAWSAYYQYVHRYLRDVVRLDPGRALSQRLRAQIVAWPGQPFFLGSAHAGPIVLLRPPTARIERAPVTRPHAERETEPAWIEADNVQADIDALASRLLDQGTQTLAAVTTQVLAALPAHLHYLATGWTAAILARRATVESERERPWRTVHGQLDIEDWSIRANKDSHE